jgi:threonylcarbamoyladenosine tRNA methylthiotransferase MtaB
MRREGVVRVHVSSLGCKLNQSEMDALAARLQAAGHELVASPGGADVCILNTCAVTHVAAQKSRQAVRRLHRDNPGARLVVTGCYAELSPADLRDLPGVETVAGNRAKDRLLDDLLAPHPLLPIPPASLHPRTRALVKIQDGCDNACTYCIIHVARGEQRSRPAGEILDEVRARLAAGYQEIVLTGVHVGAYGRDRSGCRLELDLWGLVARILAETGVARLRLSSVEPWDLPGEALALWQDSRLCRHLHLPLQSGSAATLRRMGRRYDPAGFAALAGAARAAVPGLALTSDLIVGFPGETEAEFEKSLAFVRAMAFARLHVFPFSARPGTPAAGMPGQVPPGIKAERAAAMRAVGAVAEQAFARQFVGQTVRVLWESDRPSDGGRVWSGLTDNYLRVDAVHGGELGNTFGLVRLLGSVAGGLKGEIVA